jgi:hypothetical protein
LSARAKKKAAPAPAPANDSADRNVQPCETEIPPSYVEDWADFIAQDLDSAEMEAIDIEGDLRHDTPAHHAMERLQKEFASIRRVVGYMRLAASRDPRRK